MRSNNIEPNKNLRKTRLQEKTQFHGSHDIVTFDKPKKIPTFLIKEKEKFIKELTKLEIDRRVISKILEEGIPSPDINLIIEMISYNKSALTNPEKLHNGMPSIEVDMLKEKLAASSLLKNLKKNPKIKVKHYASYDRGSEFEKLKSKEDTYRITHEILNTKDPIERYEKGKLMHIFELIIYKRRKVYTGNHLEKAKFLGK